MQQIPTYNYRLLISTVFFIGILFANNCSADFVLTAPPRESYSKGKAIYEPIAKKLSKLIGEPVVYQRASGWFDYSKRMRENSYDIIFDGPHFAAWRVKHLNHIPVASLPGKLKFLVITEKINSDIRGLDDLVGKKICGILSPNLGTNLILAAYRNPVIQPVIFSVSGDMLDIFRSFKKGKCKAAILRDIAYHKLSSEQKQNLKIIYRAKPMPNQAITISPRLKQYQKKLSRFMTSREGANTADKLLARYSNKAKYFVPTSSKKYRGAELLIEGVVFGW